ncbi:MAG: hypothetical protein L0196_08550 [candidate division Zixibacteria bacterium]|nr:hypothetical protein [candidate division Zixibacteria bacterium]
MKKKLKGILLVFGILLPLEAQTAPVGAALGLRAGLSQEPDQFVVGAQAELGKLGQATVAPSVDLGFGDGSDVTAANLDLRFYLFPLPQTGIWFYGAAGPTVAFFEGGSEEVGLSLTAGAKIPMQKNSHYNIEARFGIGDIPDLKIMLGILFGL